jgi:hypothetical protein
MTDPFEAVPAGMAGFSSLVDGVSTMVTTAGSADSGAMLGSAAGGLGLIGQDFLVALAPATCSNLAGTLMVGGVYGAISAATDASQGAIVAADALAL